MAHRPTLTSLALASALATLGLATTASAQPFRHHHRQPALAAARARDGASASPGSHLQLDGTLSDSDPTNAQGRHERSRSMSLRRGDQVTFGVSSEEIDAYAIVVGPTGQTWEDDDGAGQGTDALVRFVAPADGTYRFVATSYDAGATGSFHVDVNVEHGGAATPDGAADQGDCQDGSCDQGTPEDPGAVTPAPTPGGSAGRTFGVFVGISSYGGENEDLPGSAADAVNLERAFERSGWMQRTNAVVLTDAQATTANIHTAFQQLGTRVGANDTFVFFFDGHGASNVLETVGANLRRDDLARMLDRVGGHQLVVLDTCHAAGFAPIVQGHPNRFGLFSSRSDELSSTAPEVNAGGWLAYFVREGVAGGVQRHPDGSINYGDLVRYVEARYDRQGITSHQHLVATAGQNGGDFALGGRGDAAVGPDDTAVASRDPFPMPAPGRDPGRAGAARSPQMPGVPTGGYGGPDAPDFGQLIGTGLAVAGQIVNALSK